MSQVKIVSRRWRKRPEGLPRPVWLPLLLLTLWPVVYLAIFMLVWVRFALAIAVAAASASPRLIAPLPTDLLVVFVVGMVITLLLAAALLTFYLLHLVRNTRIAGNMKAIWALILVFGGLMGMPAYWYLYLWRADDLLAPPAPPAPAQPVAAAPAGRPG